MRGFGQRSCGGIVTDGWRHVVRLALALVSVTAACADVRVVGSDLFGVGFSQALYRYAGQNGLRVVLAFDGSRPGLAELRAGRADCALVALPPGEDAILAGLERRPFAYQPVVVLAPTRCPVEEITFAQLALVFGARPAGESGAVRWRELGAAGPWADQLVAPVAPAAGNGIALDYFRRAVLADRPLRRELPRFATSRELRGFFGPNSKAMAIAALPAGEGSGTRPLRIRAPGAAQAIAMSGETVHRGEYPLRLPIEFVFAPQRRAEALRIARFLFSDEAAAAVLAAELMPLPASDRAVHLHMAAEAAGQRAR